MGTLYLVATPIGNLEDMTFRAVRILREVRLIAAEDTRSAGVLLQHFDIHTSTTSLHDNTAPAKIDSLVDRLGAGEDLAIISEAGMPAVSDPGFRLVRAAIDAGFAVTCVPGPFAAVSALAISGLPTHAFRFVGFLPRRAGERLRRLEALALDPDTIIFYESPHRLVSTLRDAVAAFGPDRQIAVGRELTKKFEEVVRASLGEALQHFEQNPPRGEFTLVVAGTGYRGNAREPEDGPLAETVGPGRRRPRGRSSTRSGNERRRGAQLV